MAAFTGRKAELRKLLEATDPQCSGVPIHTVNGMPGVGKTSLATRAAHLLADRYPDGQLFVRLYGHTHGQPPANPADVLADLLTRIGVAPQNLPDSLDARSALWRDRSATRRILLILDDASDVTQVEPLLPSSRSCLVLITSRQRLIALEGTVPLPLETLPPEAAAQLFTRLAQRTPTGPERDSVAVAVRLCGYLPLAISLLAARLAHHPSWSIAQLTNDFAAAQEQLTELEVGNRAVAAAFDLSYRDLPTDRKQLFRRLGWHPGPDIDAYATAALTDLPLAQVRRHLEALYSDHLLDEPAPGRYRLHDLVRAYARMLAAEDPAEQCRDANVRLLAYYRQNAESADQFLVDVKHPTIPAASLSVAAHPDISTREQALAWMRTERPNLLACAHNAAEHGWPDLVPFAATIATFLYQEGPWRESIRLLRKAAATAEHIGDRLGQANALWNLGRLRRLTNEYPAAADLAEQALALYRELGNRLGEAHALQSLSRVRYLTGQYETATDLAEQAQMLYRELGDRLGEAQALRSLGVIRRLTGDYESAADLTEQALTLHQELGDHLGEAHLFRSLGVIRRLTGDYESAADLAEQALTLHQELGDHLGEAHALQSLSRVRYLTGQHETATDLAEQAQALYRELGDRLGEAEVLNSLGTLLAMTSGPNEALPRHRQALNIARQVQSPLEEARALAGIARCAEHAGAWQDALAGLSQAVNIFRSIGAAESAPAAAHLSALNREHGDSQLATGSDD
ncbi:ATP-binding protein [Streptomyces sp. NPDC002346]